MTTTPAPIARLDYVLIGTMPRKWQHAGQAYELLTRSDGSAVAHVQWNAGHVSTVPIDKLVRW